MLPNERNDTIVYLRASVSRQLVIISPNNADPVGHKHHYTSTSVMASAVLLRCLCTEQRFVSWKLLVIFSSAKKKRERERERQKERNI